MGWHHSKHPKLVERAVDVCLFHPQFIPKSKDSIKLTNTNANHHLFIKLFAQPYTNLPLKPLKYPFFPFFPLPTPSFNFSPIFRPPLLLLNFSLQRKF